MRFGCAALVGFFVLLALGAGALWVGSRLAQEPDVVAAPGSAQEGSRAQQKIFDLIRGDGERSRARSREVTLTEGELNWFLSKNVELTKLPVAIRAVRLAGDGVVELKALLPLRAALSASPVMAFASLLPASWLDRQVWLHLDAKATVEVGATRSQRRYLRLGVQHVAIGRQPLPVSMLGLVPSLADQGLLRWRMPESVEQLTITPGAVVIRTSS